MNTKTDPTRKQCLKCGKTMAGNASGGSLTAWLFRSAECKCDFSPYPMPVAADRAPAKVSVGTADKHAGTSIDGRYKVISHLGSGGMGEVYRVYDQKTESERALKLIQESAADDDSLARRLAHEADAVRVLSHPNIVALHESGTTAGGRAYLLMDYVSGKSFDQLLSEGKLPVESIVNIFIQIAKALAHAHSKGVVHRDLKPGNVLISKDEEGQERVKLVDFGIAKISQTHDADKVKLTQTGELIGSPLYMSPEQCRGDELDARSDIYSFGCMLYQAFTLKTPFDGENPVRVLLKHMSDRAPSLPKQINPDFNRIVHRCLAKNPIDRYQTANDLLADLERLSQHKPLSFMKGRWTRSGQRKATFLVSTTLVACLAAFYCISSLTPAPELKPYRPDKVNGKSLAQLDKAVENNPNDANAYFERGMFHKAREERENAIDDFSEAIRLNPEQYWSYYYRSQMNSLVSRLDKAMADANLLVGMHPTWSNSYKARAWVNFCSERYHAAIADGLKAHSLYESAGDLARSYSILGQHQKALDFATEGLRLASDPDHKHWAYLDRAMAYLALNQWQDAFNDLSEAEKIHHLSHYHWALTAHAYAQKGDMEKAEHCMKKASALDAFPARAHREEGDMYRFAGQWSKAVESYSASTSLEPWYGPGYLQRAIAEIALGELNSAFGDLKKATQSNPYSAESRSYLAMIEDQLGHSQQAQNDLDKAFQTESDLPINFVNRARICINHGQYKQALESLNQAIALDAYLAAAYDTRAIILDALNKKDEAYRDRLTASKLGWQPFAVPLKIKSSVDKPVVALIRLDTNGLRPGDSWKQQIAKELVESETSAVARINSEAQKLLAAQDFEGLDKMADQLRSSQQQHANGAWFLDTFYISVEHLLMKAPDQQWVERIDVLNKWCTHNPRSITAKTALLQVWTRYATKAHEVGFANKVTPEGAELFEKRLQQAEKILKETGALPSCPRLFYAEMQLAIAAHWSRARVAEIFKQCMSLYPGYKDIYLSMYTYLLPAWYGKPGEAGDFIAKCADSVSGDAGDEFYARLVWFLHTETNYRSCMALFIKGKGNISWDRTKKGFELLLKSNPGSKSILDEYGALASLVGDQSTIDSVYRRVGQMGETNSQK